ncbi:unnamed protein product, partial [Larinioides sclopetarius]
MLSVLLVAITLSISTIAVANDDIYVGNKFTSSISGTKSTTETSETAVFERVGNVYDYRSNNGIISPLSYISVPQSGYRKFREAMRQFQNFPSVFQHDRKSSGSGIGYSVEDKESESPKAVNSSDYSLPIKSLNFNTVENVDGPSSSYRDNYGTLFTGRYML